jgi:hypothetical protein
MIGRCRSADGFQLESTSRIEECSQTKMINTAKSTQTTLLTSSWNPHSTPLRSNDPSISNPPTMMADDDDTALPASTPLLTPLPIPEFAGLLSMRWIPSIDQIEWGERGSCSPINLIEWMARPLVEKVEKRRKARRRRNGEMTLFPPFF